MPAIQSKNAWSNGPSKSVGCSTDDPGQTSKAATTQPASHTKQGGKTRNRSTSRTRGGHSRSSLRSRTQPPPRPEDNQETGINAKLVGYTTFNTTVAEGFNPYTALILHRNLTANVIDIAIEDIAYNFVEILPKKKTYPTLYIPNAYNPPNNRGIVASKLIVKAQKLARSSPVIIAGDFNAHHPAWGFKSFGKKPMDNLTRAGLNPPYRPE
ncbi:hypothetical protein HPB51_028364 [Rhipicephalus microplus]|uniref:Endonuclease/exonuclease/phosphatase domain-containing protein n=1 Tax=Rhipicephalus microplus TaxID=6941 RepID=A0A9J6CXI8_RHIMP|nr:hypothetical protein HPB51_028364 [Rhipicephalus microplus]